jgi:hypothetical protein
MAKQAASSIQLLEATTPTKTRAKVKAGKATAGMSPGNRPLVFGAPVGSIQGPDFNPIQVIYNQNVMPRPNGLDITFTTTKGSMPVVTLWHLVTGNAARDMVPANFVATQFGIIAGVRYDHAFAFDDLDQTAFYWFRIIAGNDEMRVQIGPNQPAEYVDMAGTLQRDVTLFYDRLDILATGGSGEGDDVSFDFAAYDVGPTQSPLLPDSVRGFENDSVDDGESLEHPVGGPITLSRVGPRIAIYAMGGGSSFGRAYIFQPPDFLPDTPYRDQDDVSASANAWALLDLPDTMGDRMLPSWVVSPGLFACSFNFMGRIEVTVSDPKHALDLWPREVIQIQLLPPGILPAAFGGMPHRIVIGGRRLSLRLSPLGEIYLGLGRIDRETWRVLGESGIDLLLGAAVVSNGPGAKTALTLVARRADGHLVAGYLADIESGSPDWRKLGLKTKDVPQLVRRQNGAVAVFALDESGHLYQGDLTSGALSHGMKRLGGPFKGTIAATEDDDGHLFVAMHDGKDDVWHLHLHKDEKWHHHDAPVRYLLSVSERKDEKMVIYGIDDKRRVHAHRIGKKGWKNLGTPEEIVAAAQQGKKKEKKV